MIKKSIPVLLILPLFYLLQVHRLQPFMESDNFRLPQSTELDMYLKCCLDYLYPSDSSGIYYEVDSLYFPDQKIHFTQKGYSNYGVLTFRGGPYRDFASVGTLKGKPTTILKKWVYLTEWDTVRDKNNKAWGGGAGWTGQPVIIQWPSALAAGFDSLYPDYRYKEDFCEVIIGSLSKKIHFIDLESGKASRSPLKTRNPIKGSVSVKPGIQTLLFTGQGIPLKGNCGMMVFDLNAHKLLWYHSGSDRFAYRGWTAFDSSPLMDADNNTLWWPGENGLLYQIDLDYTSKDSIPPPQRFRYKTPDSRRLGTESSMAAWRNLAYLTDNDGNIICIDLEKMALVWIYYSGDDTDASPVIEVIDSKPFIFTGTEVDKQGESGFCHISKLDGLNGKPVWKRSFKCFSIRGEQPLNGGMLATPLIGKHNASGLLIVSLAHYPQKRKGELIAINSKTGEIAYTFPLRHFSWSSPVDLYDRDGNMYIFAADAGGYVYLIDGSNGNLIDSKFVGVTFDASPAAFDNQVVLAARGNKIFCFSIE